MSSTVYRPEMPFLAASGVAVVGSTVATGHLPKLGKVILGIVGLMAVASATTGTRFAPVMQAFGYLCLLVAVMNVVSQVSHKRKV